MPDDPNDPPVAHNPGAVAARRKNTCAHPANAHPLPDGLALSDRA
jgi:hypothetical protein